MLIKLSRPSLWHCDTFSRATFAESVAASASTPLGSGETARNTVRGAAGECGGGAREEPQRMRRRFILFSLFVFFYHWCSHQLSCRCFVVFQFFISVNGDRQSICHKYRLGYD